ncbi:MAG: type 4a pilus biogenesis protein PilO [Candidatus Azambacteria bacterium]|nr:type 4a pilus biogenesis protein PilO [Candidatus Azambacteria bacterium]
MSNLFKYFIFPIILFIIVSALAYWVLLPLWNDTQIALELRRESKANLVQRKELTANLENLVNQYNKRIGDVNSAGQAIPVGENIPDLLIMLEALASENGLILVNVDFKTKEPGSPGIKILTMEVQVTGSYSAFQNYLKAAEKSLRLFDVMKVSFNGISPGATQANANELKFNLSIDTYYQ